MRSERGAVDNQSEDNDRPPQLGMELCSTQPGKRAGDKFQPAEIDEPVQRRDSSSSSRRSLSPTTRES